MKRLVAAAAVIIGLSVTVVLGTPAPSGATGAPNSPTGYRLIASDGEVFGFGGATDHGSAGGSDLRAPIVGTAVTPTGMGYWLVGADGGVFGYGDAQFYGSTGSITLNQPIVGITAAPDGKGYWLVGADGGVFSFGDAGFYGSAGALHLNQPIVGISATADGKGYWLAGADGGVFSFGDAQFYGSTGSITLNQPIVGISATADGLGYWLVGADGGVFSIGDATFHGSAGALHLNQPIVGISATADGYRLVAADGGVFSFGDATFAGSTASQPLHAPIVAMSSNPQLLGGAPGGESPEFSITFKNNTQSVSTFVIYQQDPSGVPGGQPLAWLTVALWPGDEHTLTWLTDYSLSWATTGVLSLGLIFQAVQQWAVTTDSPANSVQFDYHGSFGLDFGPPEPPGSLWLTETSNIPKDVASVGLGMSGEPVVAFQANPSQVTQMTPHPAYWVTAGQIPRSQVLDIDHLTNSAPVSFPAGVTAMQATLSTGDVWSVSPVPS